MPKDSKLAGAAFSTRNWLYNCIASQEFESTHSIKCHVILNGFIVQGTTAFPYVPVFLKAAAVIPDEPVEAAFPSQPVQAC